MLTDSENEEYSSNECEEIEENELVSFSVSSIEQ